MSPRRSQPKRGGKHTFAVPGDLADPDGFSAVSSDWLEWLAAHNYAHMTLVDHSYWLATFAAWAELRGVHRPADVTLPVLEAYQRHVSLRRKPDGTPLSWSTQARALVALRSFFSWCRKSRRLLSNPAADLVMPRQSHKLPAATLTRGWLTLRATKTRWDRVVPMGERAAAWLVRYLAESRPRLVRDEAVPAVFLATNGERLGATWLTGQVHRYVEASGVGKAGSCHLFRHSAATLMLEGGADIRYVQELLGHRSLASTHVYTRVAPERLAAVHAACHPGAALPPRLPTGA
jgi:integrase/recombinase XerD